MKKLVYLITAAVVLCLIMIVPSNAQAPVEVECVSDKGIKMTQVGSSTIWEANVTSSRALLGSFSNTPMDFYSNSLQRMTINNNGKIGIGIASPQRLFHVHDRGVAGGPLTEVMMLQSSNSKRPTLVFSEDGQGAMSIEYDGRLLGDDNKININDNDENPLFTFDMGGEMGIGELNPIAPLHIVKEGSLGVPTTCLLLESSTTNRPRISFSESSLGTEAMSLEYDGNGGGSTNRMHIGSDGFGPIATFLRSSKFVGIGTTTPQKPLHIEGGINEGLRITRVGQPVVFDAVANGNEASIGTSSNHALRFLSNNSVRMTIRDDGNVGIGTTLPTFKLQVNGSFRASSVFCGSTNLCSDARFKRNITPVQSSMDKLAKLQGVNYYWKTKEYADHGFGEEKQIGFVAQEIQKIFPELVHTDPAGYLAVDYTSLVPVLVEALKEQQQELENLKSETNDRMLAMEKTIKKLQKRRN